MALPASGAPSAPYAACTMRAPFILRRNFSIVTVQTRAVWMHHARTLCQFSSAHSDMFLPGATNILAPPSGHDCCGLTDAADDLSICHCRVQPRIPLFRGLRRAVRARAFPLPALRQLRSYTRLFTPAAPPRGRCSAARSPAAAHSTPRHL